MPVAAIVPVLLADDDAYRHYRGTAAVLAKAWTPVALCQPCDVGVVFRVRVGTCLCALHPPLGIHDQSKSTARSSRA